MECLVDASLTYQNNNEKKTGEKNKNDKLLKGSYDVAKKNIILCIWCNAMCLCGLR